MGLGGITTVSLGRVSGKGGAQNIAMACTEGLKIHGSGGESKGPQIGGIQDQ